MKKIIYYFLFFIFFPFLASEKNDLYQHILPLLSGILMGELYNFTNKGEFKYKDITTGLDPKKSYSDQVYSKIFYEAPTGQILEKLYKELIVDFWDQKNPTFKFPSDHESLFRESLILMMSFRKSFFKIKNGFFTVFDTENKKFAKKNKNYLYSFALLMGIGKVILENEIKNKVKEYTKKNEFLNNHECISSIFAECVKIGISEFFVMPIYYSIIGLLTLTYAEIVDEKYKILRSISHGIEEKSINSFSEAIEKTDLFLVAESGNVAGKWTIALKKILNILKI